MPKSSHLTTAWLETLLHGNAQPLEKRFRPQLHTICRLGRRERGMAPKYQSQFTREAQTIERGTWHR